MIENLKAPMSAASKTSPISFELQPDGSVIVEFRLPVALDNTAAAMVVVSRVPVDLADFTRQALPIALQAVKGDWPPDLGPDPRPGTLRLVDVDELPPRP